MATQVTLNLTDDEIGWLVQKRAQAIVALAAEGSASYDVLKEALGAIYEMLQYIPQKV